MNKLISLVLKGLVAVLPIGLTVYFIYWLFTTAETLVRPLVLLVWPVDYYFPGLGVLTCLAGFGSDWLSGELLRRSLPNESKPQGV